MAIPIQKVKTFIHVNEKGEDIVGVATMKIGEVMLTLIKPKYGSAVYEEDEPEAFRQISIRAKNWCGIYKYEPLNF